jgi:hypothetical protein
LLGPSAHSLINDSRFVGRLTSTLIPQALANTIPGTAEGAIWVDVERGVLADARPRAYGAFASLSFAVPVVFALLGFLFFVGALLQRQRLTGQYEALVQSQQTVIDTLSDELTACTDGDGSDEPAAVWKTRVR